MRSCPINELQYTPVSMKSAREAQAEAPELSPQSMLALPLFVNGKIKKESYRLPDSLCNGAVKPGSGLFWVFSKHLLCLLSPPSRIGSIETRTRQGYSARTLFEGVAAWNPLCHGWELGSAVSQPLFSLRLVFS